MKKVFCLLFLIFVLSHSASAQSLKELFDKGKAAFYSDQFEEANKYFSQILATESGDYESAYYKALTYEINFDNDKAISELTTAIGYKPRSSEAYFSRGVVYDKQQKYAEAVQDYSSAIKYNKSFTDAYFNRASDYQEMKFYDDAINDYSKVIELNPSDDIAYYNRGKLYVELKTNESAIGDFEEAIRIDKAWEHELRPVINQLNGSVVDPDSDPSSGK